jgi:hypothetical protein
MKLIFKQDRLNLCSLKKKHKMERNFRYKLILS